MKRRKLLLATICFALCLGVATPSVSADSEAYVTVTRDENTGMYTQTQTAYKPVSSIEKVGNETLNKPADMAIFDDTLYICDTGNARVLVSSLTGEFIAGFGADVLKKPTGIGIAEDGLVYVADEEAKKLFAFTGDGELIREYGHPTEPLFGKSADFVPIKVAVGKGDNLFVVSLGNTNGIVQLSRSTGEFLGYFGANRVTVSLWDRLSDVLFTDEQKAQMERKAPPSASNITIDQKGLVYTITDISTDPDMVLRKLNLTGNSMLHVDFPIVNPSAVHVGAIGNIYIGTHDGYLMELDTDGNLLFLFGSPDDGSQRMGLFNTISAVDLDGCGRLFVLDDSKNIIQIFQKTAFTEKVHNALSLYQEGKYMQSRQPWNDVLQMNSMFNTAHIGMGEALLAEDDFAAAMYSFRVGGDREGYSKAFGELRNSWLRQNALWLLLVCAGLILFIVVLKRMAVRVPALGRTLRRMRKADPHKLPGQLLLLFKVVKNPADVYDGIKRERKASALSAGILYALGVFWFLLEKYLSGFAFRRVRDGEYAVVTDMVSAVGILLLVILCHYLICSITDGEASLSNVFTAIPYACAPYLLLNPVWILLSHVLTHNEQFLLSLLNFVIYFGCAVLLIVMVREMNAYTYAETVKNILLTLFAILVAAATLFILFVLARQCVNFVTELINEVIYRAAS